MLDLPSETLDLIAKAHVAFGIPVDEPFVRYRSIRDLLEQQTERLEVKPFLVFYGEGTQRIEFSFREFYEECCRTAMYFTASGVRRGDRIAVMSFNHSDVVVQYFAAWLVGASIVPLDPGEDDPKIQYILGDSGAQRILVRDLYLQRVSSILTQVSHKCTLIQTGARISSEHPHLPTELLRFTSSLKAISQTSLSDEALLVYTSGKSGDPRGVILDQYNLLVDAHAIAEWNQVSESETMMCVLPLHHVNGIVVTLMTPLYGGSTIVLNQQFHVDRFFERISAERVAITSVVPTMLQYLLLAKLDMAAYKMLNFRHVICGSGPLTVELAAKFEQTFKIPIIHGYGLSETTCYSSFLPVDQENTEHRAWLTKHGFPSIGMPLPINEMSISDAEGNECGEKERGEIVIRGHNVMRRYLGNAECNTEAFKHGWFRSGDEGFFVFDEEGRKFFFITGRIRERITRGGVNVSPLEIDEVLMHIPGVSAGIAVGFENDWSGEEVGAVIRLRPDAEVSEERVLAFCRKHLPFAKAPKVVLFSNDLPVTSTGKPLRSRCREHFKPWKSVQFKETLAP